jgi:hypothetical protein
MPQIRVTPSGVMDKDTDVSYVSQGNYTDANDIRHRQSDGGNFGGIMPIVGNTLTNTIPDYTATNKKFRVFLDVTELFDGNVGSISFVWKVQEEGSAIIGIAPPNTATTIASLATFANTVYTTITTLVAYTPVGSFSFTATKTIGGNVYAGYFDIEFSGNTLDYRLWVENTISNAASITVMQEWIPTAADRSFRVIGSQQLEEDLYVWLASVAKSSGIISAVSEIGIIYSTDNGVTFNYNRLIRTKNLGFSTDRKVEPVIERNGNEINMYWTDGYNKPRAVYLKNTLKITTDGLLRANGGRYDLATVDSDTEFFTKLPPAYFKNIAVNDVGGAITAGNKRYTGRFLTEDLVSTEILYPTNPINIYGKTINDPYLITGDISGTITDKSVDLTITNFKENTYKYFELIVIEYVNEIFTASVVQRYEILDNATSLDVKHSNLGQENIPLSTNELLAIRSKYLTAQNIKVFDNRMVFSNMTEQIDQDLNSWAQTFTHSLETTTIEALGPVAKPHDIVTTNTITAQPSPEVTRLPYGLSEYLNPLNTLSFTSYMMNDTYRFGVQVQWKETGKWSSPYWVDDIRFDTSASNVIGSRRTANNINSNLTSIDGTSVNIYYVKFANIDLNVSVGGKYIRDMITALRFVRAERIPEVITTGYFMLGRGTSTTISPFRRRDSSPTAVSSQSFTALDVNIATDEITIISHGYQTGQTVRFDVGSTAPSPLQTGFVYYVIVLTVNTFKLAETSQLEPINLTTTGDGDLVQGHIPSQHNLGSNRSDVLYFHSPDEFYTGLAADFNLNTDKLKILGPPNSLIDISGFISELSDYNEYGGYYSSSPRSYLELSNTSAGALPDVEEIMTLETGETKISSFLTGDVVYNNNLHRSRIFILDGLLRPTTGSNFSAGLANPEYYGLYYGQIFRDLGANRKYPANKEFTSYQSIGHLYILPEGVTGVTATQSVFGGDVFNQKTHLPISINQNRDGYGGQMLGVYSQNIVNTQMYNVLLTDDTVNGFGYRWPQYLGVSATFNAFNINVGYNPEDITYPVRSEGSMWEPLFYFLEQTKGHQGFYDSTYTHRDGTILEQGYNSNSTYDGFIPNRIIWSAKKVIGSRKDNYRSGYGVIDFAELDLTNGPIMHHEIINNNFYTFQPYSVQRQYFRDASLIGAQSGTDIVIGSGSILGAPGVELSSIGLFKKWSHIKGKNQTGKDTFYWYNDQLQKIVRFGDDGSRVISDKGMMSYLLNNGKYVSSQNYPLTGLGVHGVWNDKYSEAIFTFKYNDGVSNKQFTLVYDEIKNGFVGFHSYYPNIYLPYKNTFFSTNPSSQKAIYLHDRGSDSTFYGTYVVPSLTAVMNYEPNISKNFEALQFVTDTVPFDVYLNTTNHISYLEDSDFEKREDLFYSHIKNDSTGTGVNNGNTSRLWGKWLKVKMTFEASVGKQKLINFIVKFRTMARLYNQ